MNSTPKINLPAVADPLAKAVRGVSQQLGLNTTQTAAILGMTPLECARFLAAKDRLTLNESTLDRFGYLCDIHRALARLVNHDMRKLREWLHREQPGMEGAALKQMHTLEGLSTVLSSIGKHLEAQETSRKVVCI